MKAVKGNTPGRLAFLTGMRMRLAYFCIAVLTLALGTGMSIAQSGGGGASDTPFGKPTADVRNPGDRIDALRAARPYGYPDQTRSVVLHAPLCHTDPWASVQYQPEPHHLSPG